MARNMEPLIGKRGEHTAALRRRVNSPYQYITRVCFTQYMFFPMGANLSEETLRFLSGRQAAKKHPAKRWM